MPTHGSLWQRNIGTPLLGCALAAFAPAAVAVPDVETPPAPAPSEGSAVPQDAPKPPDIAGPKITLPKVVADAEAEYPESELLEGREALVELLVTVDSEGHVESAEIAASAGPEFDGAARAAALKWRFLPATRDGQPVRARIRIPFHFLPPHVAPGGAAHGHTHAHEPRDEHQAPATPAGPAPPPAPAPPAEPPRPSQTPPKGPSEPAQEIVVTGEQNAPLSTGDHRIARSVLEAAPRSEATEALRSVPGLYIARAEGAAVGHHFMLRGFDAEHGQDIEFLVGGIPINLPGHLHGQGYADLGFLIAPVLDEVHAQEGVSDPRQGDFAVAGTIHTTLGMERRGLSLEGAYGSFNSWRQRVLFAPKALGKETFGAFEHETSDGFGQNRASESARGILQHRFGVGELTGRALAIISTSTGRLAGVVRRDDIESGAVCFHCVYDFASARAQAASAMRVLAGGFVDYRPSSGDRGHLGIWAGLDEFRMLQNYTGFIEHSQTLAGVAGRGDLIEQSNRTTSAGLRGEYTLRAWQVTPWLGAQVSLGGAGRIDNIDQSQNLLDATARNQTWDRRVAAHVTSSDVGLFTDLSFNLFKRVQLHAGARLDSLAFQVDDALGNYAEASRPEGTYIIGFRRAAAGTAWGPRASLSAHLTPELSALIALGQGYRSPQPRLLSDGETAPFTVVQSGDLGLRYASSVGLEWSIGGYTTQLSDDVAFDPGEGRLEKIGATARSGVTANLTFEPSELWLLSASATWTDARLLAPPPPSAADPNPAFVAGQRLPYVSPLVARIDAAARPVLLPELGGSALKGKAGLGFSFLAPRPLPFGQWADPVSLLDASLGASWKNFEVVVSAFNLLDLRYGAMEYAFASDWSPSDGLRSRIPARHISAGSPRTFQVSVGIQL